MSLPDYIRTEWKSRGLCNLKFSNAHCTYCEKNWNGLEIEKYDPVTCTNVEIGVEPEKCSHVNNIEFFLSTLNVWEYEGAASDLKKSNLTVEEQTSGQPNSFAVTEETLPTSLPLETWQTYQQQWENWKDINVNLSWVKRFRQFCDEENTDWFDNYCNDYPEVISYISYCENIELEGEKNLQTLHPFVEESEKKKILDNVFNELYSKRFWVHLRLFLRDLEFEVSDELKQFFVSHNICDEPPPFIINGADTELVENEDYVKDEEAEKSSSDKSIDCNFEAGERYDGLQDDGDQSIVVEEVSDPSLVIEEISDQSIVAEDGDDITTTVDAYHTTEAVKCDNFAIVNGIDQTATIEGDEHITDIEGSDCTIEISDSDDTNEIDSDKTRPIEDGGETTSMDVIITACDDQSIIIDEKDVMHSNGDTLIREDGDQSLVIKDSDESASEKEYAEEALPAEQNEIHMNSEQKEGILSFSLEQTDGFLVPDAKKENGNAINSVENEPKSETSNFESLSVVIDEENEKVDCPEDKTASIVHSSDMFGRKEKKKDRNTSKKGKKNKRQRYIKKSEKKEVYLHEIPQTTKSKHPPKIGVAWALKHLQELGDEAMIKTSQSKDKEAFVFGKSVEDHVLDVPDEIQETEKLVGVAAKVEDQSGASQIAITTEKTGVKRKLQELEKASTSRSVVGDVEEKRISVWRNNGVVRAFKGIAFSIHYVIERLSTGFINFVMVLLGFRRFSRKTTPSYKFLPFAFPLGWWKGKKESTTALLEKKMKRIEWDNLRVLRHLFSPCIKYLTSPPLFSNGQIHLSKVHRTKDYRKMSEYLIKVSAIQDEDGSEDMKGIYVNYMTEEDIDQALCRIHEKPLDQAPHKVQEDSETYRTLTIFDEEGNPQTVVKVPAEDGKLRGVLEEDFENGNASKLESEENVQIDQEENLILSTRISFDDEGNPVAVEDYPETKTSSRLLHRKMNKMLRFCRLIRMTKDEISPLPDDIPSLVSKYWKQRYRLFLRYDDGIQLDNESWYSVTPESIAAHQAERCACDTVVDAFCGAGGNAIQLAATCNHVIAIDIDPTKLAMAKHNAKIYGVDDRIEFIQGDFFTLAPQLQADVVFLAPPWGGVSYKANESFDVFLLGGQMDGRKVFDVAKSITHNIALYLPKTSNLFQILELAAGNDGRVDVEYNHVSNKRKSLTAYFGDLIEFGIKETQDYL